MQDAPKMSLEAWFADSHVVDEDGSPKIVYHGARVPILDRFDLGAEGTGAVNTGSEKLGGIWFTSSEPNAHFFADPRDPDRLASEDVVVYGEDGAFYASITDEDGARLGEPGPFSTREEAGSAGQRAVAAYNADDQRGQCIFTAYLSLRNPLVLDGVVPRETEFERARSEGHDGIIAYNVLDGAEHGDDYVVFDPAQIRLAKDCHFADRK